MLVGYPGLVWSYQTHGSHSVGQGTWMDQNMGMNVDMDIGHGYGVCTQ